MALRQIMNYKTDDILQKKAKKVEKIDSKILDLIDDMVETMYSADGVGLAAPQVGMLKRIAIIDIGEGIIKLINPEVIDTEGEQQDMEGCLSVPDVCGEVKRPEKVTVRALNEKGETIELAGTGFLARAICHEMDHLDGVLFVDKVVPGKMKKTKQQRGVSRKNNLLTGRGTANEQETGK
jgi:peptide deformylase